MITDQIEFNAAYWASQYVISEKPHLYLTKKGRILHQLVINNGVILKMKYLCDELCMFDSGISRIIKQMVVEGDICIKKAGPTKQISFSNEPIQNGLKMLQLYESVRPKNDGD